MTEKNSKEQHEHPKVHYTSYGEMYVDVEELLTSKAGRNLLESIKDIKVEHELQSSRNE